jgi:DNA helicase-2/ATP-dependent DNA helicase PcrA
MDLEAAAAELNQPQMEAVLHADGPLLVFAGAGSGKTRTIIYRIANLLAEHRVPPYRILAVTFTNKAAGEMRSRLDRLVGEDLARDLWAGTFHSVCSRLLRRYHDEVGLSQKFVIYDDADQKAVVSRVLKAQGVSDREYPPRWVLARIHAEKREGRAPADVDLGSSGFDSTLLDVYSEYQRALVGASAVDFEDLILYVMRIAEDALSPAGRELRTRFRHVLVDEFQDTNAIQYRLVRALASETRNLCVVGDDDQSIYRWRGADVRIIRGFRHDFPEAVVVKLEQNYRSSANIVGAALGVIEPAAVREPKRLWTEADKGEKVAVRSVRDEREEALFVARTIRSELARGVSAGDIAVFYRVHAQSRVLEEACRAASIAYQVIGGMKFFERAEVKDLLAYLRLIENPRSDADFLRIVNVPPRGIGDKTVDAVLALGSARKISALEALDAALSEPGLLATAAKNKLAAFRELISRLQYNAEKLSPHELAHAVLERSGYRNVLREQDTAESDARLGNLEELVGSIAEYEQEANLTGETPSLSGYLERVSLVAAVDTLKDLPTVSLMTVHSAKGLEFTSVFLTGMEEEVFPYRGVEGDSPEELDEERRLAYVAITRARQRLWITHASMRTLFGQTRYLGPSRFLGDLPPEFVQREGSGFSAPSSGRLSAFAPRYAGRRGTDADSEQPRLRPGERVVDRDAFDDLGSDDGSSPRAGDRVKHVRFGVGVIESIEDGGRESTIVARFPGYGTRRIKAGFLEFG